MEVCFRHDIKTTLKSVSSKAGKGCIIGVLKGKNHCRRSLSFGLETTQVEETTIKRYSIQTRSDDCRSR